MMATSDETKFDGLSGTTIFAQKWGNSVVFGSDRRLCTTIRDIDTNQILLRDDVKKTKHVNAFVSIMFAGGYERPVEIINHILRQTREQETVDNHSPQEIAGMIHEYMTEHPPTFMRIPLSHGHFDHVLWPQSVLVIVGIDREHNPHIIKVTDSKVQGNPPHFEDNLECIIEGSGQKAVQTFLDSNRPKPRGLGEFVDFARRIIVYGCLHDQNGASGGTVDVYVRNHLYQVDPESITVPRLYLKHYHEINKGDSSGIFVVHSYPNLLENGNYVDPIHDTEISSLFSNWMHHVAVTRLGIVRNHYVLRRVTIFNDNTVTVASRFGNSSLRNRSVDHVIRTFQFFKLECRYTNDTVRNLDLYLADDNFDNLNMLLNG